MVLIYSSFCFHLLLLQFMHIYPSIDKEKLYLLRIMVALNLSII